MDPNGRVALITGASSGIGLATARAFAAAGARVALVARDRQRLEAAAGNLPGARIFPADLADEGQATRLAEDVIAAFGGIDILVNNAGVGLAAPVAELRPDDLRAALAVNLFGPVALTQAALPHMRRRSSGHLIFVSSVVGLRALPYLGGYAACKAALDRLTESLRVELRGSGVAVTLVRPGTTDTGFSSRRLGSGHERRRVRRRGASPEQVAGTILRAARREPRVAYVSWRDRATVLLGVVAPGLTDWLLARSFAWEGER
jgi:serine 3-dehydrogenase (NADP+)